MILQASPAFAPPPARALADTGLPTTLVADQVLKAVYFAGTISTARLAETLHVRFSVISGLVREMVEQAYFTTHTVQIDGRPTTEYVITQKGEERARHVLERGDYNGPLPVPLWAYAEAVRAQASRTGAITREQVAALYSDLVLPETLLDRLGPAINSARSLFLYGAPGNGKTTIAQRIAELFGDDIYIPYALAVDTQIIRLFDPAYHHFSLAPIGDEANTPDERWVRIRRPVVIVGGELTLETLDLLYEPTVKYYEAPPHLKANNGVFLIDDFGRQLVTPRALLNRWIVPLAEGVDYLTLHTGQRLQVPFNEMIIFSTNLKPRDLVDEAFLRRIPYKLEVPDPSASDYREIFRRVCHERRVPYDDGAVTYLLMHRYPNSGQTPRACHPRDLVAQICDIAAFRGEPPRLTPELLDLAWDSYFARF